jgi:hypothetical protein
MAHDRLSLVSDWALEDSVGQPFRDKNSARDVVNIILGKPGPASSSGEDLETVLGLVQDLSDWNLNPRTGFHVVLPPHDVSDCVQAEK